MGGEKRGAGGRWQVTLKNIFDTPIKKKHMWKYILFILLVC